MKIPFQANVVDLGIVFSKVGGKMNGEGVHTVKSSCSVKKSNLRWYKVFLVVK